MTLEQLTNHHQQFLNKQLTFYAELFCDEIWCGLGEDCATISIQATPSAWLLHYIRTQNGVPCITSEYTSEVIDEYKKELSNDELYDFLTLHTISDTFDAFIDASITKEK